MRLHELFTAEDIVLEQGGVGLVVPGVNTTKDVGPNEITKQARKFKNRVGPRGTVPKARPDGKFKPVR